MGVADGDPLVTQVAERVRTALSAADLDVFADLLDPHVTWGPPGDTSPPCQSRAQVLNWYRQGRADGRRANVLDVLVHRDKILVSMKVTAPDATDASSEVDRWQVLTVAGGRVTSIRGYEDSQSARAAAGLTG